MDKKALEYYLDADYPFSVRPDIENEGYIVEFPDLNYCTGSGKEINEAIANGMTVKNDWIKAAFQNNISIPEPASNEEYNGRITLRVPRSLHRTIIERAKKEGVSLNQFLSYLISYGVGQRTKELKDKNF